MGKHALDEPDWPEIDPDLKLEIIRLVNLLCLEYWKCDKAYVYEIRIERDSDDWEARVLIAIDIIEEHFVVQKRDRELHAWKNPEIPALDYTFDTQKED